MSNRFYVGESKPQYIWGVGLTDFYPLIDSETGEPFGDILYRYRQDAEKTAARYNALTEPQ